MSLNNGYIYAIEARDGNVKIGRSCNPKKRVQTIKTISGNSDAKSFICDIECNCVLAEKALHNMFSEMRFDGEWFSVSFDDAIDAIPSVCNNHAADSVSQDAGVADEEKCDLDGYDVFQITAIGFMKDHPVAVVCEAFNRFSDVVGDVELLRFCNMVAELNNDKFSDVQDIKSFVEAANTN